jgi:hypothetical protein
MTCLHVAHSLRGIVGDGWGNQNMPNVLQGGGLLVD